VFWRSHTPDLIHPRLQRLTYSTISSSEHYSTICNYTPGNPHVIHPNRFPRFVVTNVTVENVINLQQLQFQVSPQGINLGADPHKGLKDLMH
jgi:hypothetical protein